MASIRALVFAILPSRLKVSVLRRRGGRIGRRVRIGIGTTIDAKEITLEDDVEIGHQSLVRCDQLHVGTRSKIGSRVYVDLTRLQVGTDTQINDEVVIAGPRSPRSECTIGNRCILLMRSFVNTSRPVFIEDNVGVGNEAMIFTHGVWQSAFDGYPFTYAPVTLRKGCWIPARVFVMPGVEIGEGATVGADSLVTKSVPPFALAYGVPAKVVSEPPNYPRKLGSEEKVALVHQLAREFVEQLRFEGVPVGESWGGGGFAIRVGTSCLKFPSTTPSAGANPEVVIFLEGAEPNSGFWLHFGTQRCRLPRNDNLSQKFAQFARTYGVHFASLA